MYLIKESGTNKSSEDIPKISNYISNNTNGINITNSITNVNTSNITTDINGVNHTYGQLY
jgi:hypothetical protein